MKEINIGHLFWIIPLVVFLTIVFTHPNMYSNPVAWHPGNNKDVTCYGIRNHFSGFDLYVCDDGEKYYDYAYVSEAKWKGQNWASKMYCYNEIERAAKGELKVNNQGD